MRQVNFTKLRKKRAKYLEIADQIKESVLNKRLAPGDPLPSSRQLALDFKVHKNTILNSLEELKSQGWILSKERSSYFINSELPTQYFTPQKINSKKPEKQSPLRIVRKLNPITASSQGKKIQYNFSSGKPDFRLFPKDELKSFFSESFKRSNDNFFKYDNPLGEKNLRKAVEEYIRRIRGVTNREILITNGSQEAIFIVAQLFLKQGDIAAVEGLGYLPAIEALRSTGAVIKPIKVDSQGINPDSLERVLQKNKIRVLYLTPLHQYPSTVTLPLERRAKIYKLAKKYHFIIIEDDYDHEYHYHGHPLGPMAANDPCGLVMYTSSFSKLLFPSLRIGFLAIPKSISQYVSDYKKLINHQSCTVSQNAVARWIEDGGFERHLKRTRKAYHLRRDVICEEVDSLIKDGFELSYAKPEGGMALWLKTQKNSSQLFKECLGNGIFLLPESKCRIKKQRELPHIRLGFAGQNEEELRKGIKALSRFL